jgi:hypothetical protein
MAIGFAPERGDGCQSLEFASASAKTTALEGEK